MRAGTKDTTQAQAVVLLALKAAREAFDAVLAQHRELVCLPEGAEIHLTICKPSEEATP